MKKILFTGVVTLTVLVLTQCNQKKDKLQGVWKLDYMELNGTRMDGSSMGTWLWEFNEEGGYLTMVAGAKEKGKYTLKNNTLVLKSVTYPERPETEYRVTKLDSAALHLNGDTKQNKTALYFIKTDIGEGEEEED